MGMETIEELFEHELKDIYSAEQSLLAALEQMARESSDRDIRKAFTQHRKETQGQIKRLDKVFKGLGQKPEAQTCAGMEGLIKEKKMFVRERPSAELLEFYNIGAAQKTERYEITAYETLIDMADKLGFSDAVELLEQNLLEEEATLNKL
jgi:ferritin-like metal-binding protein YciE